MAKEPTASYISATKGKKSDIDGYYRFLENDDKSITPENLIQGHKERTIQRSLGSRVVLGIQDEVNFNFTSLAHCNGLRKISTSSRVGTNALGLVVHSTLGFDPEKNVSLGILNIAVKSTALGWQNSKNF